MGLWVPCQAFDTSLASTPCTQGVVWSPPTKVALLATVRSCTGPGCGRRHWIASPMAMPPGLRNSTASPQTPTPSCAVTCCCRATHSSGPARHECANGSSRVPWNSGVAGTPVASGSHQVHQDVVRRYSDNSPCSTRTTMAAVVHGPGARCFRAFTGWWQH